MGQKLLLWPPGLVGCLCYYLKAGSASVAGASMINGFHGGARMDDLIRVLEEMRKEVLQLKKELRELKTEKKEPVA